MADQPKGNIFFEIAILILVIALIGTILYPKQVWQKEDELETVCHARMEAIQYFELYYNNVVLTYSDTLKKVKDTVLADEAAVVAVDSLVNWDKLVETKDLEQMVLATAYPEDLRSMILKTLADGKPLRNLGKWESLDYKLIDALEKKTAIETEKAVLDTGIAWSTLVGERGMQAILENTPFPGQQKNQIQQQLRKGAPIQQTRGWTAMSPAFYSRLSEIIQTAKNTDIWEKKNQDAWKEVKRKEWEASLDQLSLAEQDTLWQKHERAMWDKVKDVIWKQERTALWNKEKDTWPTENRAMWHRIVSQQWEADRKKAWLEEQEKSQPSDSALAFFKANRDSLWRSVASSLQDAEFDQWASQHKKDIKEAIEGLWQSDKRVEWEESAHERWQEQKNADKAARWKELKEDLWNTQWVELWKQEEEKMGAKNASLRTLDLAVKWEAVLGKETVSGIVQSLSLPTAEAVWQKVSAKTDEKGSALYRYGLAGLYRNNLVDSIDVCPVARDPYLIHVVDTSVIKKFGVACPIVETTNLAVGKYKAPVPMEEKEVLLVEDAPVTSDSLKMEETMLVVEEVPSSTGKTYVVSLVVDPATQDTIKTVLKVPASQKLFGGGSIRPHGLIDEDGKKSWEKKGR